MNKKLLILAVAGLALASCSNDEVVESAATSDANVISFRPNVGGITRSADVTQTWLQTGSNGFYVTATYSETTDNESGTLYFDNAHYVYNSTTSTYTCSDKYYWPAANYLNFYAYAPAAGTDISRTNYKTFVVTPNKTASTNAQQDLVYASTMNQTKAANGTGVSLTFHHAESKISLNAKNSSATMDFTITGPVQICNVYRQGTFAYTGIAASKLKLTDWQSTSPTDYGNYSQTAPTTTFNAEATAASISNDLILIPQAITAASAYRGPKDDEGGFGISTGSYILIPITIKQKNTSVEIYSGQAIWPIPSGSWAPGMHYTYTVDLAGGGYYPLNQDADTNLDPIVEGAEIIFATVTVDSWDPTSTIIGNFVYNAGGTYTDNIAKDAGVYYITIKGLDTTESITSVEGTNCMVSPANGTASDGTFFVTCTVTENTSTARNVTVTVTGATHTTTITLRQAAAS